MWAACARRRHGRWGEAGDVKRSRSRGDPVVFLWYFSCPCIPVETHLRLFPIHTNSVLQGTYRQLMCLKAERAISQRASSLKADWHAFVSGAITNIRAAVEEIYCSKRRLFVCFTGTQTTFVLLLINVQLPENFQMVSPSPPPPFQNTHAHTHTHVLCRGQGGLFFFSIQPPPLRCLLYEYSVTNTEDTKGRRDSADEK